MDLMNLSPDAVAVIGFVALFALMLLRVPVGMAMGLVGVCGYSYIAGSGPALKLIGQTSMRTVTDYTFGVIPMFMLMGAFVSVSGVSRELFRAANAFIGHLRGGLGMATLIGGNGRDVFIGGLPRDAPLRLPAIVFYRCDRRRWHLGRHAAAVHCAGGLRHPDTTRHWQAVHGGHHSRLARHGHVCVDHLGHCAGQTRLVAARSIHHLG